MGELQHKLLEAMFKLNSDEESISDGSWYLIPDQSLRILEKYESSSHPGFIPDGGLVDPYGIVYVWLRSTSLTGDMPEWLIHGSHFHDRTLKCPLDQVGIVGVANPRRLGAHNFRNLTPKCRETDKVWLNSFYACREKCRRNK
jgi:hypothetical protein